MVACGGWRGVACRYIRAAACPKDVVILLDVSGSMKGLRIEIAKATVEKILDTLTDDDFFNVIMVTRLYSRSDWRKNRLCRPCNVGGPRGSGAFMPTPPSPTPKKYG